MYYSQTTKGFYTEEVNTDIPEDAVAVSYAEYLALLEAQVAGKVIKANAQGHPVAVDPPTAPPASAPTSVTMRQARLALLAAGKYSAVNAAMADADEATRIEWEFAATVDRDSQTTQLLAAALNLNDAKLDELFTAAGKL